MIKSSNGDNPFSLTYKTEAVIPAEIGMPTIRIAEVDLVQNNEALEINLYLLEERREEAAIREAKSKAKIEKKILKCKSLKYKFQTRRPCISQQQCKPSRGYREARPQMGRTVRDILAIQISTVASEAAFSTGGRVLDPYRTRLSTTIVKALICTQDWVRKSRTQINWDDVEDLIKDDEIVKDMEEQLEKLTERDKAKQTGEI
ncbi:reverse transcriptase domain-containing protein [Tanacetum coccineum]